MSKTITTCLFLTLLLSQSPVLAWINYGHVKYSFNVTDIPAASLVYPDSGEQQTLNTLGLRLATENQWQNFSADIHYEVNAMHSNNPDLITGIDQDKFRSFDLSSNLRDENNNLQQHRLDRLSLAYTGANLVARLGRQAVS